MNVFEEEKQLANKLRTFLSVRSPVSRAIQFIKKNSSQCVLFGGVLRDIVRPDSVTPSVRDVDVVVYRSDIKRLESRWPEYIQGRNRFGGLRLNVSRVPIDIWAIEDTWAFRNKLVIPQSVYYLSRTTFLNIDGITADLSVDNANGIKVLAKDFLFAFRHHILDITLNKNPFPTLVAIKALRAMHRYDLSIGYSLAVYLYDVLTRHKLTRLEKEQARHYRRIIFDSTYLCQLRTQLHTHLTRATSADTFSAMKQLEWW
jgi:hypothetical protein